MVAEPRCDNAQLAPSCVRVILSARHKLHVHLVEELHYQLRGFAGLLLNKIDCSRILVYQWNNLPPLTLNLTRLFDHHYLLTHCTLLCCIASYRRAVFFTGWNFRFRNFEGNKILRFVLSAKLKFNEFFITHELLLFQAVGKMAEQRVEERIASCVRRWHIYNRVWTATVGEKICCSCETGGLLRSQCA